MGSSPTIINSSLELTDQALESFEPSTDPACVYRPLEVLIYRHLYDRQYGKLS